MSILGEHCIHVKAVDAGLPKRPATMQTNVLQTSLACAHSGCGAVLTWAWVMPLLLSTACMSSHQMLAFQGALQHCESGVLRWHMLSADNGWLSWMAFPQ